MSFRLGLVFAAASSLAIAFAVGCGDTTNVPDIIVVGGDSGPDATGSDIDGGSDAADAADAQLDADPSCGIDMSPVSDKCQIIGPCMANQCAGKDSVRYDCANSGGGTRPDIIGCARVSTTAGADGWCCPRACIRAQISDSLCAAGEKSYACAPGEPRLAPAECTRRPGGPPTFDSYCCPP